MEDNLEGKRGIHHFYRFEGTPYEVGFQHGQALKAEILSEALPSLEAFAQTMRMSVNQSLERVVARYEPLFRERLPQVLEEIRGIGDGAGLSYAHTFFAAVQDGMPLPVENRVSCTAFSCGRETTAFNNILLGQTKDTNAPLDRYRIMHITYNSGRRILILNYPGWTANICVTSDGLSFAGTSLYGERPPNDTVPFSLLKRIVMEKSSVSQVLDAINNLTFENSSFLIGDSTGHLVCLEYLAGLRSLHDVTHQAFGHANSVLSPELKKYESATTVSCSSVLRQRNIEKLLDRAKGSITVDSMKHILADHTDFPLSICRHIAECDPTVTTAAFVANLTTLTMDIAIGNPCVGEFKSYQV